MISNLLIVFQAEKLLGGSSVVKDSDFEPLSKMAAASKMSVDTLKKH